MSKDTRRTANPTLSENTTLLLSSLQNSHTFQIQTLHEKKPLSSPLDFFPFPGILALGIEGMLISKLPFFPFIFQNWSDINSSKSFCIPPLVSKSPVSLANLDFEFMKNGAGGLECSVEGESGDLKCGDGDKLMVQLLARNHVLSRYDL